MVANYFNTDHYEKILDISSAKKIVYEVLSVLDEPMGDSSIIPMYLLSKFARERVVVALGGDGSDELFAGYATFKALNPAKIYSALTNRFLRKIIRRAFDYLPVSDKYLSVDFKIKRALRGLEYPEEFWNPIWLSSLEPFEIETLLEEPIEIEDLYSEVLTAWQGSTARDLIGKTSEFYARFYLQNNVLAKVDRASMMVGLEVRAPFLDNQVVDFARRLPSSLKYRNGESKFILKASMKGRIPDEVIDRPKKGFGVPLTSWMRSWGLPQDSQKIVFNQNVLNSLKSSHMKGIRDEKLFLWNWYVLQTNFSRI
jgi:asparagine synthase (glutamine-hydrolysing)